MKIGDVSTAFAFVLLLSMIVALQNKWAGILELVIGFQARKVFRTFEKGPICHIRFLIHK